jgi:2-polyprenyl-6-hydroxyphenyl methylase/3-demethylubiquinone-9 3-methyltransferase
MFNKPVIDNDIYNRHSDGWWSQDSFLNILETGIQPVRSEYVRHCLASMALIKPNSLDIGCGGGIIAEDLAEFSATVTGVDISTASLETARKHAKENGLDINYMESYAESLPFADNSFELVTCCDVLEHVEDVDKAISEIERVLKPGGIFVYDTVNRTFMSYLALIFIAQDFPLTRFAPKNSHVWHKFIRPQELQNVFRDNNLTNKEEWGMEPSVNPISMVWYILKTKYLGLDFGAFGNKTKFKKSKNKSISYLGYCVKQ